MSPEKLTAAYAEAMQRLEDKEHALVRTFNAWDKLRRSVRRYEGRLDRYTMSGTEDTRCEHGMFRSETGACSACLRDSPKQNSVHLHDPLRPWGSSGASGS